jgi:hypothetical protein
MQVSNEESSFLLPSTLETVDMAFYDFINNKLDIFATSNEGFKKVPIIWITAERAFLIKDQKDIREIDSQTLVYPLISIERTSAVLTKPSERPVPGNQFPYPDYKQGTITVARKINKEKTRNFTNALSKQIYGQNNFPKTPPRTVYQYMSIPFPVYVTMDYQVKIRSQYQQQINEMMLPFMRYAGGWNYFTINYEGLRYEVFLQRENEYKSNSSNQANDEKKFDAVFKFKVMGYTTSTGENQKTPSVVYRENAVVVRFPRERVMLGDINEFTGKTFTQ